MAWNRYADAMSAAERPAGEALAARAEARQLLIRLEDLAARFGLEVKVPAVPDGPNQKLAWLLGKFLAETAMGKVDETVVRDLAAARRPAAS